MAERHVYTLSNGELCICGPSSSNSDPARPGWRFERGRLRVYSDEEPATLTPSDEALRISLPTLRATATIVVPPLKLACSWNFGWIMACASLVDQRVYGKLGEVACELPHAFVNASDGTSVPWHGSTTQRVRLCGPTGSERSITVSMTTKLADSVPWYLKLPPTAAVGTARPQLTAVKKQSDYMLWLVAANDDLTELHVLKTYSWTFDLRISVDCSKPLQQRATLESGVTRALAGPELLAENVEIPEPALRAPTCDQLKRLVWYPAAEASTKAAGASIVLVPPEWEVY